jgi:hypothetical protein
MPAQYPNDTQSRLCMRSLLFRNRRTYTYLAATCPLTIPPMRIWRVRVSHGLRGPSKRLTVGSAIPYATFLTTSPADPSAGDVTSCPA